MPKIHRHRGVTTEVPIPGDPIEPDEVEVLTDTPDDAELVTDPGELVEAIVVDEHGDDAAAVEVLAGERGPETIVPATTPRKRAR